MEYRQDTIAAIATAPGAAGIAVVRISGPRSLEIADGLFKGEGAKPSQRSSPAVAHGYLHHADEDIDEVLMLIMRKPRSYTREDTVEIQCHGGNMVSRRILRAVLSAGARVAEPGEFTARAFLNGRIDLLQAEAVADLIGASTERAAASALEQLKGNLSRKVESVYTQIIETAANIEACLDFSDEEMQPQSLQQYRKLLQDIEIEIDDLLKTHAEGRVLRDGLRVAIAGQPNVGKSTLLNKLLESERAIVSPQPGTTRDTIEERVVLNGYPLVLTDTAGLRETECEVEEEGMRRTLEQMESADVHIYIIDSSLGLQAADRHYLDCHDKAKCIIVQNKTDLGVRARCSYPEVREVFASLMNDQGTEEIRTAIAEKVANAISTDPLPHSTISERHYHALSECKKEIHKAKTIPAANHEGCEVLIASHLRFAAETLGKLLGKEYHANLLNTVFSRFCIGK